MADSNDFGAKLKELETITEWFESEEVDLNQGLAKFERGMKLAADLKGELGQLENRVEKIKQKFDTPAAGTTEAADAEPPAPTNSDTSTLF